MSLAAAFAAFAIAFIDESTDILFLLLLAIISVGFDHNHYLFGTRVMARLSL